jgi:hypothetical protein
MKNQTKTYAYSLQQKGSIQAEDISTQQPIYSDSLLCHFLLFLESKYTVQGY